MKRLGMIALAVMGLALVGAGFAEAAWGECNSCQTPIWNHMWNGHDRVCPPGAPCGEPAACEDCPKPSRRSFWSRSHKSEPIQPPPPPYQGPIQAPLPPGYGPAPMSGHDYYPYYYYYQQQAPQSWHNFARSPRDFFMDP